MMVQVFGVGQVVSYLRDLLEQDEGLADLWIAGEVSNFSRSPAGHSYFVLKDAATQLRCVLFRGTGYERELANGRAVIVHGRVSFYEPRGELQVVADIVQPEGVGALALELERLRIKLEAEGLFDPSRKRPLPRFPQRIGVVTSPTGAVWHDIQNVIARRYPLVELVLAPTSVQGDGAAESIARAIHALNLHGGIDLILVARGGGSLEDLWAFNEEPVARAIYASRIPVISGVGHETDVTIADYVADVRAPTPSAAAEIAVPDRRDLGLHILTLRRRLEDTLDEAIASRRDRVALLERRLTLLLPPLARERQRVDDLTRLLTVHLRRTLDARRAVVVQRVSQLEALHPQRTLARGYAVVQRAESGAVVTQPQDAPAGTPLRITVAGGAFPAQSGPPIAGAAHPHPAPAPAASGADRGERPRSRRSRPPGLQPEQLRLL